VNGIGPGTSQPPLKCFGYTMPVALPRVEFKAGQGHAMTFFGPSANPIQCRYLPGQALSFVIGKQSIVIRLGPHFTAILGGDAKFRQMLVTDADILARGPER
jgi:hypothetical protein